MKTKKCETCAESFEYHRSTAQYCGDTCKKKAQRGPTRKETESRLEIAREVLRVAELKPVIKKSVRSIAQMQTAQPPLSDRFYDDEDELPW